MTHFEGTPDRFPEGERSRAELLERARQLSWYHTLRLDETLITPGIFALDEFQPFYLLPQSLHGLRCLEVGTGNGYWAFLMERRGAQSVTATDIGDYSEGDFSLVHGRPRPAATRAAPGAFGEPYRVAASLLASRVDYRIRSVYELASAGLGTFDLVFCSSVLMHLFAPLIALRQMAAVCGSTCVLTTETDIAHDGEPLARYRGVDIPYVHFIPSPTCLGDMLRSCGYERVLRGPTFLLRFRDREKNPDELPHTTFVAVKAGARPAVDLGEPRLLADAERRAMVDVVRAPPAVAPGREFSILVRVTNDSRIAWRGDSDRHALRLAGICQVRSRQGGASPVPLPPQPPFVDYLPAGTSTLARLRVTAPPGEGSLEIQLAVSQAGRPFPASRTVAVVPVVLGTDGPGDLPSPGRSPRLDRAWGVVRAWPGSRTARRIARGIRSRFP